MLGIRFELKAMSDYV